MPPKPANNYQLSGLSLLAVTQRPPGLCIVSSQVCHINLSNRSSASRKESPANEQAVLFNNSLFIIRLQSLAKNWQLHSPSSVFVHYLWRKFWARCDRKKCNGHFVTIYKGTLKIVEKRPVLFVSSLFMAKLYSTLREKTGMVVLSVSIEKLKRLLKKAYFVC